MLISQKTIDDVNAISILDVVQKFNIEIKRAGATWKAKSPFTDEKTGSFMVSPGKNVWKCFSTGIGGGSGVSFAMQYKKIEWFEAIKLVADMFDIFIDYDDSPSGRAYQEKQELVSKISDINAQAAIYFQENWNKVQPEFIRSTDAINEVFNLGFAPNEWNGLMNYLNKLGFNETQMLSAGLITQGKTRKFDTFRGRVMFPIYNYRKQIIGFSGRIAIELEASVENDTPKVFNSKETDAFSKSKELLGIYQAKEGIIRENKCIVVEGNYDVTSMFQVGFVNTVAALGTAFTKEHCQLIGKFSKNICFFIDNDAPGLKAIEPRVKTALENEFHVSLMIPEMEGSDPDDWCKMQSMDIETKEIDKDLARKTFMDQEIDAVDYLAKQYFSKIKKGDTIQETKAEQRLSELLSGVSDGALRSKYIKKYAKQYGIDKSTVEKEIDNIKADKTADIATKSVVVPKHLRSDEEIEDFKTYGFYPVSSPDGLGYYFQQQNGPERVTNWLMRPLFMVEDTKDAKRFIELHTTRGKIVVEMPNSKINNPAAFEEQISNRGGFFFHGTKKQFQRLKSKFLLQFPSCKEIKTLGWHYDGFFAYANGIIENGIFKKSDLHGLVKFADQEYFLPVFSTVYKELNPDEDVYASDRKFTYKTNDIGFEKWAKKFNKVYSENNNGYFAIAFLCASLFADFIYSIHSWFPMMNSYGMPRTGKTTIARSTARVISSTAMEFSLHGGTPIGLQRLLAQKRNTIELADEFRNDLDMKTIQTLKRVYDRSKIPKGQMTNDNRTIDTPVNSVLWFMGQHMCTVDSGALLTRCISREFMKTMDKYTNDEILEYEELREWEKKGLSDVVIEIIRSRSSIEQNYLHEFTEIGDKIRDELRDTGADGRVVGNHIVFLAVVKILSDKLSFPFTYEEFYEEIKKSIQQQSLTISSNDDLADLFQMMEFLAMQHAIKINEDYKLEKRKLHITIGRGETEEKKTLECVDVLYIKMTRIYPMYAEHTRKQGNDPLPQSTLISYFKNHRSFIGPVKGTKFNGVNTSAFAFDYNILDIRLPGLNDEVKPEEETPAPYIPKSPQMEQSVLDLETWPAEKNDDDLPF